MRHQPIPLPGEDADEHNCTIWYIGRRLGRGEYGVDRLTTLVNALIEQQHFPKPLPYLRSRVLTQEVGGRASWLRAAVDQWLADFLPPDIAAGVDAAALREAANRMDANAANLQLGKGRGLKLIDGGRS